MKKFYKNVYFYKKSYYYKNVFNNRQPSIEEQEASSLKTLMSWLRRGKLPVWVGYINAVTAQLGDNPLRRGDDKKRSGYYRGVEQSEARRAHYPKVVGSSPTPSTKVMKVSYFFHGVLLSYKIWRCGKLPTFIMGMNMVSVRLKSQSA